MGMLVQFQLQQAVQVVVLGPELVSKFTSVPREGETIFQKHIGVSVCFFRRLSLSGNREEDLCLKLY